MSLLLNKFNRRLLFKCDRLLLLRTIKKQSGQPKLVEIGKLLEPRDQSYETGQLFLHRIFGYRGMILFPWTARVYDRDLKIPNQGSEQKKQTATVPSPPAAKPLQYSGSLASGSTTGDGKSTTTTSRDKACLDKGTTTTASGTSTTKNFGTLQNDARSATPTAPPTQTSSIDKQQEKIWHTDGEGQDPYLTYFEGMDSPFSTSSSSSFSSSSSSSSASSSTKLPPNPKPFKEHSQIQTFYQVLIDARDCPFIRTQTEAVTFLGTQDCNRNLYSIPGLDNAAHSDIMPYCTKEKEPIKHELFDKFLTYNAAHDPPFVALDTLQAWKDKNHPWLDMTDVHKQTTEHVRITVIPFYMGARETPVTTVYWWRYCIRLENLSKLTVQLRERHWRIFSLSGTLETVRGRGVVGQEPILSPTVPAFQYSSHVSLLSPSGHMWGTFRLEREDGYSFDCKIPPFSLDSKPDDAFPTGPTLPPINTSEYSITRSANTIETGLDKTEAADTTNGFSSARNKSKYVSVTNKWITEEVKSPFEKDDKDH